MGERVAAALYILCWALLRRVPERAGRAAFRAAADRSWRRRSAGVLRLEANLARAAGPAAAPEHIRALSRAGMRSYLRYFYEMFTLPALTREQVLARVDCTGAEAVRSNTAAGRGVVAALPHMGNWDLAGAWITHCGIPLTTVAERVRPEALFERFAAFREGIGMEVLPLTGGPGHSAGVLARRLRSGRLVCLLADRDLTERGVEVDLFGHRARMPAGPAALAERTGAALLPVTLWYAGERMRVHIHPEIPVPAAGGRSERVQAMTQELARVFENAIAEHPQDWHMLQRVFTADLPPRENPGSAGSGPVSPAVPGSPAPRRGPSRSRRRMRP
ncbi:phosphatidylinositol mannoside acyltransferase [Streptomonospora sediminis]